MDATEYLLASEENKKRLLNSVQQTHAIKTSESESNIIVVAAGLLMLVGAILTVLAVYWLIWQGYMLLIAYWCANCSTIVLTPNYWYFAGTLLVFIWILNLLQGNHNV